VSTPLLLALPTVTELLGVDVSGESIRVAQQTQRDDRARFCRTDEATPEGNFALGFCNGVFHHIPLDERHAAARYVFDSLRRGGVFAFWENNPWNPGTRWTMHRCEFDEDAICLSPPEARGLLRGAGFEILRTDFVFFFPRLLRLLRPLEPRLAAVPLGGQYLVLCRKR
jgi:SAM-dependent methyltransferase